MASHDDDNNQGTCPICKDTDCVCPDNEVAVYGAANMLRNKERNYSRRPPCKICGDRDCVCPPYEVTGRGVAYMLRSNERIYSSGSSCLLIGHTLGPKVMGLFNFRDTNDDSYCAQDLSGSLATSEDNTVLET